MTNISLGLSGLTIDPAAVITRILEILADGEARPGDHASLSVAYPSGVTKWASQAWGVGSYGDTTYGTGSNPTDYTASDGQELLWQGVGNDGNTYHASAPIRYAAETAPVIEDQVWTADDDVVSLDVSVPGTNLTFIYAAEGLPGNAVIDAASGVIAVNGNGGTFAQGDVGSGSITITATDHYGRKLIYLINYTIALPTDAAGTAPVIEDQVWTVDDDLVSLDAAATGTDLTFTYAAEGLPPNAGIDAGSGMITVSGNGGAFAQGDVGSGSITVTATDQYGRQLTYPVGYTIALRAPATAAGALGPFSFAAGMAVNAQDLAADFTAAGNTLAFAIAGSALPPGLSLSAEGVLSGTPATETADATYTLRATDEYGRTTDSSFPLAVTASTQPLTVSGFDEANDSFGVTSTKAGMLHYGFYPAGTGAGDITAAEMVTGSDTGLIDNGTAGFFAGAGELPDVDIDTSALTGGTPYVIAFVVDIDDGGTYTNLALQSFTLNVPEAVAPTVSSAVTDAAGDTITLTMSESVSGTQDTANWAVNDVTGGSATIDSVTVSGSTITLELSGNLVQGGDAPTVDYTAGDIAGVGGNALASFTDQAVTNNVAGLVVTGLSATYVGENVLANNGTTSYSFPGESIGAAAPDRDVYVVAQCYGANVSAVDFNSGTPATPVETSITGAAVHISIWRANITSGSTADIDVSLNQNASGGVKISVYDVKGRTSEPETWFRDNNSIRTQSKDFNVSVGDVILGAVGERGGGEPGITSGVSQDGTSFDTSTSDNVIAASASIASADPAYTVEVTGGSSGGISLCFVQIR